MVGLMVQAGEVDLGRTVGVTGESKRGSRRKNIVANNWDLVQEGNNEHVAHA